MKTLTTLAILATLTACGTEPTATKEDKVRVTQTPVSDAENAPKAPGNDPVQALYIDKLADRPECQTLSQLIYVVEESKMYACGRKGWTQIDFPAPAIPSVGKDGLNGQNGKDAPYVGQGEWMEPGTTHKWFLGQAFSEAQRDDVFCAPPARIGSSDEIVHAVGVGLSQEYLRHDAKDHLWVGRSSYLDVSVSSVLNGQVYPITGVTYGQTVRVLCLLDL